MRSIAESPKHTSLSKRWDWILSFMVVEDMFVHEILMMMEKRATKGVPTMGVSVEDARIILYYNPDFIGRLSDPELRYVLTHEIYHVVLHHCTHRMPENPQQKGLWNKAADLAVNSLIPNNPEIHMPKNKELRGLMPKDFEFESKLSMEQYIQLLRDQEDDGKGQNGGVYGSGDGGDEDEGDEDKDKLGGGFDSHDKWKQSEIAKEMVRSKVQQLASKERAWGNMPADVKALIMAAQKSQVNWRRYLRHYLGDLVTSQNESTFKRPNRRFGYPYCGEKRKHTDRKLVAIDTSGSVGDEELAQFLTEVNRLAEIQPVDLQLFDARLQGDPISFSKKKAKFNFTGRGGTNFHPVMELAEKRKYQSLIMLTDGEATAPPKPKHVKDIIWVITGGGKPPVEWGKVVKITPSSSK